MATAPDTANARSSIARNARGEGGNPRGARGTHDEIPSTNPLGRAIAIATRIGAFLVWRSMRHVGLARGSPAKRFAGLLESLGTSFVKLGQQLSLRSDLFPPDYLAALQELQDNVKPFPGEQAMAAVEKAFGRPPSQLFARFDPEPLAAASVAQVHAAQTFDGREVMVKVLRPGVAAQVDLDMRVLLATVRFLSNFSAVLTRYHAQDVVRQIWTNLVKELDLREESRNAGRFAVAFKDHPTICIPAVVEDFSARNVMVMERVSGGRVDDARSPEEGAVLAQNFLDAFIYQFFMLGFFHADPHPGNLIVLEDGRISLIDFGIVGSLDRRTRQSLAAFMLAFAEQDAEWVLESWLSLGMLSGTADKKPLQPVVAEIMAEYARRPLKEWSIGGAFGDLVNAARDRDLAVPLNLLILGRAILLIEGTVRKLDPDFNLLDAMMKRSREVIEVALTSEPSGQTRLKYETAVAGTDWQRLLAEAVRKFREEGILVHVDHEGLPELADQVVKGASRVSLALVTLGLYLAASLLMQQSFGPRVLEIPILAFIFYVTAGWFTIRLVRAIGRGI